MSATKTAVSEPGQEAVHEDVTQETIHEDGEPRPQRASTRAERQAAREAARSEEQRGRQQRMQQRSARELAQAAAVRREEAFREEELALMRQVLEQSQQRLEQHSTEQVGTAGPSGPIRNPFDKPVTIGAAEAEARYEAQMKRLSMLARADFFRAIALITVVVAIVATPIYAMAISASPEAFAAYIAPVTGIAGAVVGYWFGASGQNKSSESANPAAGSTPSSADQ